MAVIPYEKVVTPMDGSSIILIKWEALTKTTNDTGQPYICPNFADKSIQIIGTFGVGGICTIQGSNMPSTPTYATLTDPQGNALTITAAKIEQVLENTYLVRPAITGGDATTDLDVYMLIYSSR